jgi:HlyD family type I secretion membrane fusion protein
MKRGRIGAFFGEREQGSPHLPTLTQTAGPLTRSGFSSTSIWPAEGANPLVVRHTREARALARRGGWVLMLGVAPALAWLAWAPLSSAVVTQGFVKVDLNRRTIQHAEGGTIRVVHVRDGQKVKAGEPLIELGDVSVAADHQRLLGRLLAERAGVIRLEAEQSMMPAPEWPGELLDAAGRDPNLAEQIRKEQGLFAARRSSLRTQSDLLQQQREKIMQEMVSLRLQIDRAQESIKAQRAELDTNKSLVQEGYIAATRIMQLQATVADYGVKLEERRGELVRAEQRVVDINLRLRGIESDYRQQASDQLKVAQSRVSEIEQDLRKATDAAQRQVIVAPVDGEVMGLRFTTPGSVLAPRETIADVVPADPRLLVETRIRTEDINRVHLNQHAELRFTSYKYRTTPLVPGRVSYVSADRVVDKDTSQSFYTVQVEVDAGRQALLGKDERASASGEPGEPGVRLQAGMPAEIYLQGEVRTPLRYLIEPVLDALRHAGRER